MAERLTLTCATCGETFTRLKSQHYAKVPYCSAACRATGVGAGKTRPLADRLWEKVDKSGDCWVWTASSRNNQGYGLINTGGHDGPVRLAHRVAYELTSGPIPEGMEVCHRCDNPLCCRPDHLLLGTHAENMRDMGDKGRAATATLDLHRPRFRGVAHGQAKLSGEQVREIRTRYAAGGVRQTDLAREYGVTQMAISRVVRGASYVDD